MVPRYHGAVERTIGMRQNRGKNESSILRTVNVAQCDLSPGPASLGFSSFYAFSVSFWNYSIRWYYRVCQ